MEDRENGRGSNTEGDDREGKTVIFHGTTDSVNAAGKVSARANNRSACREPVKRRFAHPPRYPSGAQSRKALWSGRYGNGRRTDKCRNASGFGLHAFAIDE